MKPPPGIIHYLYFMPLMCTIVPNGHLQNKVPLNFWNKLMLSNNFEHSIDKKICCACVSVHRCWRHYLFICGHDQNSDPRNHKFKKFDYRTHTMSPQCRNREILFYHKSVATESDRTWNSTIGFLRIVSKTVGLQFKAIWQTRHFWNKKGWS